MNEFELINLLTRSLPTNSSVVTGAGDDCAVLDLGLPAQWILFKTDAVVVATASPIKVRNVFFIGFESFGRLLPR